MINNQIIIGFDLVFKNENSEEYLKKINLIPKNLLIDASTFLLSFNKESSFIKNHSELLSKWFGKKNNIIANDINDIINKFKKDVSQDVSIINPRTSLTLFEKVLSSDNNVNEISNPDFEILLFKIYLSLNQVLNKNDELIIETSSKFPDYPKLIKLGLGYSLPTFDISNYNLPKILVIQVIKAVFLFEFLEKREEAEKILKLLYIRFKVKDYKEFLGKLLPIGFNIVSAKEEGKFDLRIANDEKLESNIRFLEKLSINKIDFEESEVDFLSIRANPLIKIDSNTFRIVFPLFAIEKIFNGLYFVLKEINENLSQIDRINLRQLITYEFSEKYIFYNLMERTFTNDYKKLSGESIKTPGAPDFYIRKNDVIYIFESKDVLISAKVKESYNFVEYEKALKEKLFYYDNGKKESPKAVRQLANFSKKLLYGSFSEDIDYVKDEVKIYPIIFIHNRQLDILGLNNLINIWFEEETKLMIEESVNISNLRFPTIICIDTFIELHEYIARNELKLHEIIDDYQYFIDRNRIKTQKFPSTFELLENTKNQLISFNMYVRNKYHNLKLPELFNEKGLSLL